MKREPVLDRLAEAFERKDAEGLGPLVSDAYSGLRFSSNWTDATWRSFAAAFREAKFVSGSDAEQIYELRIEEPGHAAETKQITLARNDDGRWLLVYRTFLVTPHF